MVVILITKITCTNLNYLQAVNLISFGGYLTTSLHIERIIRYSHLIQKYVNIA
jgi:hypothetical protein